MSVTYPSRRKLDTVATASKSQSWTLDALGNWSGQTTGATGGDAGRPLDTMAR